MCFDTISISILWLTKSLTNDGIVVSSSASRIDAKSQKKIDEWVALAENAEIEKKLKITVYPKQIYNGKVCAPIIDDND